MSITISLSFLLSLLLSLSLSAFLVSSRSDRMRPHKSEFVGIMHNAKCIMHNYMFLFVGAAIGSPFVGYVIVEGNPPYGFCFSFIRTPDEITFHYALCIMNYALKIPTNYCLFLNLLIKKALHFRRNTTPELFMQQPLPFFCLQ